MYNTGYNSDKSKNNFEQGGPAVPVTVLCSISAEEGKIMEGLKELLKKRWRDPRDEKDNTLFKKACVMDRLADIYSCFSQKYNCKCQFLELSELSTIVKGFLKQK